MKNLICFLFVLFSVSSFASESPRFRSGQQLTVVAPSGLTLRDAPSKHGEAIHIIDYGEEVQVLLSDESESPTSINWTSGRWILVSYEGIEGYVFDGYLSHLPLPINEFELCQSDLYLSYPLRSWADYHFMNVKATDTIQKRDDLYKLVYHFEKGNKLIVEDFDHFHKTSLLLSDVRIMDAYHLLMSMLPNKIALQSFKNNTIFITNHEGELSQIKVKWENNIRIDKKKNGQVAITIFESLTDCSL